jgi:hypothetical protein
MKNTIYSPTNYNRNLSLIENSELLLEVDREQIYMGAIAIPIADLIGAESVGVTTIRATIGPDEYWTTLEQLKYLGKPFMGFYVLTLSKWEHNHVQNEPGSLIQQYQHPWNDCVPAPATNIKFYEQHKGGKNE